MRLAVFASGNGSNFQAIAEAVACGTIKGEICFLFCDKKEAYALQRAKTLNIPSIFFSPKEFKSKDFYEKELLHILEAKEVDLIILAGYMRIIGSRLLDRYAKKILNIHPSLLPNFPGLNGIRDAYEAGVRETGVTIHYVDHGIDTGPIVAQEKIIIDPKESFDSLERRIHQLEHKMYPSILAEIINEQGEGHL